MKRKCVAFFWGAIAFSFAVFPGALSAYALSLDEAFHALKNSEANYALTSGLICEDVAALYYKQKYYPGDQYEVLSRIALVDKSTRQRSGELDLVVVEKSLRQSNAKVVEVVEVKCWDHLGEALNKAVSQRDNYQRAVSKRKNYKFVSLDSHSEILTFKHFAESHPYTTMSQLGGREAGFDVVLPFSLDELKYLERRIIQCQREGECKPATMSKRQRKASRSQSF